MLGILVLHLDVHFLWLKSHFKGLGKLIQVDFTLFKYKLPDFCNSAPKTTKNQGFLMKILNNKSRKSRSGGEKIRL